MKTLLLCLALLLALVMGSQSAVDYEEAHSACGTSCANENGGSGTCDFDMCRLCCELDALPEYFDELCATNSGGYFVDGGGHCDPSPNACSEDVCSSLQLLLGGSLLTLQ